jgi:tetratricopeptide (TPR) repeat protein
LSLNHCGKLTEALEAMSRAIEIDPAILEFYRERSKYYFLAEEYVMAIQDCRKAELMDPDDEEVQLLLSFYLYLND